MVEIPIEVCDGYLRQLQSLPEYLQIERSNAGSPKIRTQHGDFQLNVSYNSRYAEVILEGPPAAIAFPFQLLINYHKKFRSRPISQFQPYRELVL